MSEHGVSLISSGKCCLKCKQTKSIDEFGNDKTNKDGKTRWCSPCMRESNRKSYQKNKTKHRARAKVWWELNREQFCSDKRKKRDLDPRVDLLYAAKHRAKQKGLEFDLEPEDTPIPERCPVLGIEISRRNTKQRRSSPSIDRIDSTKGYTKDNVQVISWLANTMKTNATKEELLAFANWVRRTFGQPLQETL